MGKLFKNTNGITLIALIVTIIVLIILAGISINLLLGDNGIMIKARLAAFTHELETIAEQVELERGAKKIDEAQTGILVSIFSNRYEITDDTPSTLIAQINEVRQKKEKEEVYDENDEKVYYIPAKLAGVDGVYVYDLLTGTVFKIPQTKIGGQIYHYVRAGLTEMAQGQTPTDPDPDPPTPPGPPGPEDTPEDPDPNYPNFIPIYSIQDFKKVASGELQYEIRGTKYDMIPGAIYKLMNDIDFGGETLTSLPEFTGIFYGQNYTLKNFKIDNTAATTTLKYYSNDVDTDTDNGINVANVTTIEAPTGIFSRVVGGTALTGYYAGYTGGLIQKLKIDNVESVTGKGSVALLIGDGANVRVRDIEINPVSTTKTVINSTGQSGATNSYSNVAGIIAYLYDNGNNISEFKNIKIKNIKTTTDIENKYTNMAGIVAMQYGKASYEGCFIEDSEKLGSGIVHIARNALSLYNCWSTNSEFEAYYDTADSGSSAYKMGTASGLVGVINSGSMLTLNKGNKAGVNIYNCGVDNITFGTTKGSTFAGIVATLRNVANFEKISIKNLNTQIKGSFGGVVCAIYPISFPETAMQISIDNVEFKNNIVYGQNISSGSIAAIAEYVYTPAILNISNIEVSNSVLYGSSASGICGTVRNGYADNRVLSVNISNSTIKENSFVGNKAAATAIWIESAGDSREEANLKLDNCEIKDLIVNTGDGGSIVSVLYLSDTGGFDILNTTISNIKLNAPLNNDETIKDIPGLTGIKYTNSSGRLGGIVNYIANGHFKLKNSTIDGIDMDNVNGGSLGGIIQDIDNSYFLVENSTIKNISLKNSVKQYTIGVGGLVNNANTNFKFIGSTISNIDIEGNLPDTGGLVMNIIGGRINEGFTIDNTTISDINITNNEGRAIAGLVLCQQKEAIIIKNNSKIKDITVTSNPAGNSGSYFAGLIGWHTYYKLGIENSEISNITVNSKNAGTTAGIIAMGYIESDNAKISNITVNVEDSTISYGQQGGLMGYISRESVFKDSEIDTVTVNTKKSVLNIGGIAGCATSAGVTLDNSTIKNIQILSSEERVSSNLMSVGGIIGVGSLKSTENTSSIQNITVKKEANVGGIVGTLYYNGELKNLNIKNVTVENKNTVNNNAAINTGGIVGTMISSGKIESITVEDINVIGDGNVGGIAGKAMNDIDGITGKNITVKNLVSNNIISNSNYNSNYADTISITTGGVIGSFPTSYDKTVKNINLDTVSVTNGVSVGGVVGTIFISGVVQDIEIKDLTITAETGKKIYAAGGVVGHGGNPAGTTAVSEIKDVTIDNLQITNSEFSGGIAGIAVPKISGCEVKNSSINATATNTGYIKDTNYTGGYAGGIIGAAGYIKTSGQSPLVFSNNKVKATTISGGTVSGDIYGAGTYYLDSYTGEQVADSISSDCIREN